MKVSLTWIKYYIENEIDMSPEQLAEKLTLAGIAVENIHYLGQGIENVVTGKVVEMSKHPEADKLWICKLDVGQEEILTIVTGAQNVTEGAIVPVAVVGAKLPNGMKMKKAKLRGVDSYGMLCSASELDMDSKTLLPEQREGIFILPATTKIGLDIRAVLGLDDVIFEFELTANRADCFGVIGIAREVAAITGGKLQRIPSLPADSKVVADSGQLHIQIANSKLCERFSGCLLEGVKIAPSPLWIQNALRVMGVRPINNVVDITNFVMLEQCRPMHAYDADKVQGATLVAREAFEGEVLVTLDEQKRTLTKEMLVIADTDKALGVAGVMGGFDSEVTDATTNIILESASFYGPSIRRTGRNLGLRSEASARFERGTDIESTVVSIYRAVELLQKVTTVDKVYEVVDCYPQPVPSRSIEVQIAKINTHLGVDLTGAKIASILTAMSFGVLENEGVLKIDIPSWRTDIVGMVDVAEEVARHIGFDSIQSSLPVDRVNVSEQTPTTMINDAVRDLLVAAGLDEVINYSFIHPTAFDKLNLPVDHALRKVIDISNPITDDFTVLRTTLLSSVLQTVAYNVARRNEDVAIFEVGNAYISEQAPLKDFPTEIPLLAGAWTGKRGLLHWSSGKEEVDFYDVKGLVTDLLSKFGVEFELVPSSLSALHPGKSADVVQNGVVIGSFGQAHPVVEKNYDFVKPVYVFELQLLPLIVGSSSIAKYKSLSKYPFVNRDLAILIPDTVALKELQRIVEENGGECFAGFKLFDVYTGKQVQEGFKSVAFTVTFQANDRTLTDKEVEDFTQKILAALQNELSLSLRS